MAIKAQQRELSYRDLEHEPKTVIESDKRNDLNVSEVPDFDSAPDGGTRAWLVAAGGCAIFFCCLGFSNAFGTLAEYYLSHKLHEQSPANVAWIGSISVFVQFAVGVVGGPMFDRFGAWIIRPAAIAYVVAVMLLSLCKEYWQFMLVQGILMGIIMGFLQFPAFAAVSQYFDKKRAMAFGVVIAGSSLGGIVNPIALAKMLNGTSLGFGWSVRIIGFLMIPFMLFACIVVRARLPPRTTDFWIFSAYKDPKYILLILAVFCMVAGMFTPLFFMPTYAVMRGMDATLAGYLLAIINAASTFGRVIPGVLADKYGRLNAFAFGGIATGIVTFCLNSATTTAGLIIYSIVFGFCSGTIISGAAVAFSLCPKDPRNIGTYMGMGLAWAGVGGLIGPPVNGVLVDQYGGFSQACFFSGAMCTFGGIIAAATKATTPEGLFGRV